MEGPGVIPDDATIAVTAASQVRPHLEGVKIDPVRPALRYFTTKGPYRRKNSSYTAHIVFGPL